MHMSAYSTRAGRLAIATAAIVGFLFVNLAIAQKDSAQTDSRGEWPQFLGPHRNGLSEETGLLDRWPEAGPKVEWRSEGGVGMSGLAISRGRLLTLVQRQGKQWLIALNAETGAPVWQAAIAPDYKNAMGDGPRATPTIHGDQVFVFTGEGVLAAINFADGKALWSHKTVSELSGKEAEYGMASSPLVVDDLVIVTVGAPEATLAAYETKSGKLRWKVGSDAAGYSSPTLLKVGGKAQIVSFTGSAAIGVAPDSGKLLWRYPFQTNYECNIATPLLIDGKLLLSAGENHGSTLLKVIPDGETFKLEPEWESLGPSSVLRSEWQTSVLLDGYLYGMDNVGGAGPITHLTCVEAATGKRKWQQVRFGKGNLIAADGKLFITTMKGDLVMVRATPDRFEELGRATLFQSTRQSAALANGRLYIRDDQEIICVDVRKK